MKEQKKNVKKKENAITLIALIISIIVLLILAGVSLSALVGDNGILTQATRAADESIKADKEEKRQLTMANAAMNSKNRTYTDSKGKVATIPAGFAVSEVDGEKEIDTGLVIIDSFGNEFVWVPVDNPSELYGVDSSGQKHGKLYNFYSDGTVSNLNWSESDGVMSVTYNDMRNNSAREPDILTDITGDASEAGISLIKSIIGINAETNDEILNLWKNQLISEFNKTIESIEEYKGFYISRFEISKDENNNICSKAGGIALTSEEDSANTWYGLYQMAKQYKSNFVTSSMIWGCEYDAMLRWMQSQNIDVTLTNTGYNKDIACTGTYETDKVNNIYDLYGGRVEYVLTAVSTNQRFYRGGYFESESSLANKGFGVEIFYPVGGRTTRTVLTIN